MTPDIIPLTTVLEVGPSRLPALQRPHFQDWIVEEISGLSRPTLDGQMLCGQSPDVVEDSLPARKLLQQPGFPHPTSTPEHDQLIRTRFGSTLRLLRSKPCN